MLVSGAALAQGVTAPAYDTYQDARGGPFYSNNLTTLPDDRDLLGPGLASVKRSVPGAGQTGARLWRDRRYRGRLFRMAGRPARQIQQSTQAVDDQRRMRDARDVE